MSSSSSAFRGTGDSRGRLRDDSWQAKAASAMAEPEPEAESDVGERVDGETRRETNVSNDVHRVRFAGEEFWRESELQENLNVDSNGNRIWWRGDPELEFARVAGSLEEHPHMRGAYWHPDSAEFRPQVYFSHCPRCRRGRRIDPTPIINMWIRLVDKGRHVRRIQRLFHVTKELLVRMRLTEQFRRDLYWAYPYEEVSIEGLQRERRPVHWHNNSEPRRV